MTEEIQHHPLNENNFLEMPFPLSNIDDLREQVNAKLQDETIGVLRNFSKVDYIDSSGIGILASLLSILNRKKIRLYLVGVNRKVENIFNMMGMRDLFIMAESTEELLRSPEVLPSLTVVKQPILLI